MITISRALTALLLVWPTGAAFAETYTVNSVTAPAFATVASATAGITEFVMSSSTSAVTVGSGNGEKVKGTTTRSTVTIRCANGGAQGAGNCNASGVMPRIKIGATGAFTGRAQPPTDFTVTSGTGTVGSVTTNGDGSIEFTMNNFGGTGNKTFFLGMTLPVGGDDSGGATGNGTAQFYVRAIKNPSTPTTGLNQNATVTVRQSLEVTKISDLAFGTFLVPSASGSIIIDPSTGARTTSGTAPTFIAGPVFTRAEYTISGEAGTTFTITVPATFTMTNGTTTLTVTTNRSATGTLTLTGGTYSFGVGGTLPVAATNTRGSYSGSMTVTFTYN